MKIIKWVISLILFAACLILTAEIYQNYLNTFNDGMYYFYDDTRMSAEETEKFCRSLQKAAQEEDVYVFAVSRIVTAADNCTCEIFATEDCREILKEDYGISEGVFESLLSGVTTVKISDFSEWTERSGTIREYPRYFIIGTEEQAKSMDDKLHAEETTISHIKRDNRADLYIIVVGVWGVAFLFLLLLTWFGIQFDKKKDFLKISLGCSTAQIITRAIIQDIIAFSAGFIAMYLVFRQLAYVGYGMRTQLIAFSAFLVLNSILHFSLLRPDYKAILYGANLNQNLLVNCYALKTITSLVVIFSLSVIFVFISQNTDYIFLEDKVMAMGSYQFLDFQQSSIDSDDDGREHQQNILNALQRDERIKNCSATALRLVEFEARNGEEIEFLQFNQKCNQFITISGFDDIIDGEDADYYVFVPQNKQSLIDYESLAYDCIYRRNSVAEGSFTVSFYDYGGNEKIFYFEPQEEYGFSLSENPFIIYCALTDEELQQSGAAIANIERSIFNISSETMEELRETYGLDYLTGTSVGQICERSYHIIKRIMLMNGVLCLLLLLLEIFVISVIVRLEYMINAKLLTIQKILGYSLIQKHNMTLILNFVTVIGGIGINALFSVFHEWFPWWYPLLCGAALMIFEVVLMIVIIQRYERANAAKILKGGSL